MMMRIFAYIILFIILFVVYIRFLEHQSVFLPSRARLNQRPVDIGLDYENIDFYAEDGVRLNGWFVPAEHDPQTAVTLLFFHGNAGNIGDRLEKIDLLHSLDVNIFIFDYRGYGVSQGHPSEQGMYLDAQAAFDYLIGRSDIRHDRIVAYGVSLGGAAAVDVAVRRPVCGLVMHATFTSGRDMAKKIFPVVPLFLIRTEMNSVEKIKQVTVPKLIVHAREDDVIPFEMGQRLFESALEPKQFLEIHGSHNDAHILDRAAYLRGLDSFLKKYF